MLPGNGGAGGAAQAISPNSCTVRTSCTMTSEVRFHAALVNNTRALCILPAEVRGCDMPARSCPLAYSMQM
eukprot:scaffold56872_cov18-Tisochrysis_lutea.AAC.2